jgi:hypothetical protein
MQHLKCVLGDLYGASGKAQYCLKIISSKFQTMFACLEIFQSNMRFLLSIRATGTFSNARCLLTAYAGDSSRF